MTLAYPGVLPPMVLLVAPDMMRHDAVVGGFLPAAVPAALVPMKFPCSRLELPCTSTPYRPLPEK